MGALTNLFPMKVIHLSWLFFIFLSTNFPGNGNPVVLVSGQCQKDQQSLLLQMKNSLVFNSTLSVRLVQWNQSTDCCTWSGVDCDMAGHVIGLDLADESISGGIDNSSDLFSLEHLQSLNLAYNDFESAPIPSRLANLTNLTYLNLSSAGICGQIPIEISGMTRLVTLDLSCTDAIDFPCWLQLENPNLKALVQNLTKLRELYLDGVNISAKGTEWSQALSSSLPNLQVLSLINCSLSGPIHSSLADLHSLSVIYLDENNLSSPIPDFFADYPNLKVLSLSSCDMSGKLPENIFKVSTLDTLALHENPLLHGSLPNFPLNNSFQTLILHHTNLSGTLPDSIRNLKSVSTLDLQGCNFTGPFPKSMANLTQLVSLTLSYNHFTGPIPYFYLPKSLVHLDIGGNLFNGSIHPSLFALPMLQQVWLDSNQFEGQIPDISNASSSVLELLDLSGNRLEGPIPKSMANLTQLVHLELPNNHFTGPIPYFYLPKSLVHLDIGGNRFTGSIHPSLFALPMLQQVLFAFNQFEGQIPDISNPSSSILELLNLSGNRLEGPIPKSIFELKNLKGLSLTFNKLNGTVQLDMFANFGNLIQLELSGNNLAVNLSSSFSSFPPNLWALGLGQCNLSVIPNLRNLHGLEYLDLGSNQISGEIPNWIWQVVLVSLNLADNNLVGLEKPYLFSHPLYIQLQNNQLQGQIPLPLQSASYVDYSNNNFSSIPDHTGYVLRDGGCMFFSVSNNKLTGEIPKSMCNATDLQVLDLSGNILSGRIPTCLVEGGGHLSVLNLKNNRLFGIIPDRFPINCVFQTLNLNGNQLEGVIPKSLANCTMLEVLDFGNNNINDAFPCWLNNVSGLHVLILRSNKFYGDISCIEYNVSWPLLQIIDLASNNFTGRLPKKGLTNWKAMMGDERKGRYDLEHHVELERLAGGKVFQDAITLILKGKETDLNKILTTFTSIDFSSNNFQGSIPEELGLLKSLRLLNLSHNAFTGSIPSSVGNIQQLESLDLSMNNLRGHIPAQLASLNFLSVLNLSYNHLVGRIPTSTQLQSFSPTSFEGNEGLCGPPLKNCSNSTQIPPPTIKFDPSVSSSSTEFDWLFFLFIGVGFGTGFVATVAPLIYSDKVNLWYDILVHKFLRHFCI